MCIPKNGSARTGWTDVGQAIAGENEAPPIYYPSGAAHEAMSGHGCTRIDLILVNMVALVAFKKYEQGYGQGIAKHTMLMAGFDLPSFGAKVTMPRTPSTLINVERHDLPGTVKEELVYFAISPVTRAIYEECVAQGNFTEAYEIWNKAAERHFAVQLKRTHLPRSVPEKDKSLI